MLAEFRAISERGGVLGAMERMYQRSKIQEESLYYETLKHDGALPIIGVNTFLDPKGSPTVHAARGHPRDHGREGLRDRGARRVLEAQRGDRRRPRSTAVQRAALDGGNVFAALMEACKVCTLGQLSRALYEVGGQYRRNM